MNEHRVLRHALLAAVLGALGASGIALAENEREPNQPISSAQKLSLGANVVSVGGVAAGTLGATVNGVIGNLTGSPLTGTAILDVDFYSFQGTGGDVVTIDIDGGYGGVSNVDTILTVFGPGPTYTKLRENDDGNILDEGTTHPAGWKDSRITNFTLPATGTYTVAVTSFPCFLGDGGVWTSACLKPITRLDANGDYTLNISGVTLSSVKHINIEIKPGSGELAPVNPKSKGRIPVALLSSDQFNALDVNHDSLTFGATGNEPSYKTCGKGGEDVNGDGRLDLVCHFDNQLAKFAPADLEGIVKGKTRDGTDFEGRGLLKVVPAKREH